MTTLPWEPVQNLNLGQRMALARLEIENKDLTDTSRMGQRSYSHFSIHQLAEFLTRLLTEKYGILVSFGTDPERPAKTTVFEYIDRYGNPRRDHQTELWGIITLTNADDLSQSMSRHCYGTGIDDSDKSSGKATSYARKNGMVSALNLTIGTDNEQAGASHNGNQPRPPNGAGGPPSPSAGSTPPNPGPAHHSPQPQAPAPNGARGGPAPGPNSGPAPDAGKPQDQSPPRAYRIVFEPGGKGFDIPEEEMSKRLTNFIVQKNKDLTALETFKATNKASLIEWKTNDHLHNDGSQSNGISSLLNGTISALKPAAENAAA